jgi:hypothetical protein
MPRAGIELSFAVLEFSKIIASLHTPPLYVIGLIIEGKKSSSKVGEKIFRE